MSLSIQALPNDEPPEPTRKEFEERFVRVCDDAVASKARFAPDSESPGGDSRGLNESASV